MGLSPIALPAEQPVLSTARLRLRRFGAEDAAQVQNLAGDAEVADTTAVIPHPYPDGAAQAWIAGHADDWAAAKSVTWAITRSRDGALLGAMALGLRLADRHAVAGYWVGREHWGQGVATESLSAVLAWGFDALGLHRIEATHLRRNPASGRVMEKTGMRVEGVKRESVCKDGRMEDVVLCALLASDRRPASAPAATASR